MNNRIKTKYPGVYYREVQRITGPGTERVYYIVFKKVGKTHEEKVGRQYVDDMTPAKAALIRASRIEGKRKSKKELIQEKTAAEEAVKNRWTIGRLWEEYKAQKTVFKGKPQDEARYGKHLKPLFHDKEPSELIPLDVDRLRVKMSKKVAPQSVKNTLALLKRIINFGVKRGLCSDVAFHIQLPKVNNLKTEDLTKEQLSRLIRAMDEDPNTLCANCMKMALFTGMRAGELFRLKWDDLDFERGFINIRDPKGGQDQKIPLNEPTRQLLDAHPRTESPFVFPGRNGNQRISLTDVSRRIRAKAGLPKDFRPMHGLRHVYASTLASSGQVDMYTLQKLLTHKTPTMTQRYAHLRDETLKRAAELAGDLLGGAGIGGEKVVNMDDFQSDSWLDTIK